MAYSATGTKKNIRKKNRLFPGTEFAGVLELRVDVRPDRTCSVARYTTEMRDLWGFCSHLVVLIDESAHLDEQI